MRSSRKRSNFNNSRRERPISVYIPAQLIQGAQRAAVNEMLHAMQDAFAPYRLQSHILSSH